MNLDEAKPAPAQVRGRLSAMKLPKTGVTEDGGGSGQCITGQRASTLPRKASTARV